jgi:dienelactone hydrolase
MPPANRRIPFALRGLTLITGCLAALPALSQQRPAPYSPSTEELTQLHLKEAELAARLKGLSSPRKADAAVFLHLAEISERTDVNEQGPGRSLLDSRSAFQAVLRGLDTGLRRCELLAKGEHPWTSQPGRSLRGYESKIDGSIQPYGVVLPRGFVAGEAKRWRLDIDLHGRGVTEPRFLQATEPATAAPEGPDPPFITLLPFGRGNNGWRWAGETDVFECLADLKAQYPVSIDPDRTILRGFSMGGAGAWHIGVHYPSLWAAVSPGAGFTDTRKYGSLPHGSVPTYQEAAWHIYDAVDYAANLFNTPFIGYGGERDPQLQATLNMKEAADREGVPLKVIVGPNTEHRYHLDSLAEIMQILSTARRDPRPKEARFTTYTLKYNACAGIRITGLEEHYRRSGFTAERDRESLAIETKHVTGLSLDVVDTPEVRIDGQKVKYPALGRNAFFRRTRGRWEQERNEGGLRKRPGLQGPIDDAFTDRFVVLRPTGKAWTASAQSFAEDALRRFQEEWRLGFRGELPILDDTRLAEGEPILANLVLFGDPGSNRAIARIVDRLPLRWTPAGLEVNGKKYGPDALPVLVYPNPLSPSHYVVINSGHTWGATEIRASNVQLFPRLPDWAVVRPRAGGSHSEVLAADFFDESWSFR